MRLCPLVPMLCAEEERITATLSTRLEYFMPVNKVPLSMPETKKITPGTNTPRQYLSPKKFTFCLFFWRDKLPHYEKSLLPIKATFISIWCPSSLMADSYSSIAMSTTWRHCRRSAARRQAEWTPVLKGWTSRDTVLNHVPVSQWRPLGLLYPAGGLLIGVVDFKS